MRLMTAPLNATAGARGDDLSPAELVEISASIRHHLGLEPTWDSLLPIVLHLQPRTRGRDSEVLDRIECAVFGDVVHHLDGSHIDATKAFLGILLLFRCLRFV